MLRILRNVALALLLVGAMGEPAAAATCGHGGSGVIGGEVVCGGSGFRWCVEDGCIAYTCDDIEQGMGVFCLNPE